jgi:hypothetical protein
MGYRLDSALCGDCCGSRCGSRAAPANQAKADSRQMNRIILTIFNHFLDLLYRAVVIEDSLIVQLA